MAFVLILAGLATKIGWAPVHNWLPDAHSEAPAPISALLSAALLPTVVLVAWRVKTTLDAGRGRRDGGRAVPRLRPGLADRRRPVPVARAAVEAAAGLLEPRAHGRSSRSGIGFGTPLAIAGVVIHVAGHALAKSLGFYAALPLLRSDPDAAHRAPGGRRCRPALATALAMGISLGALAGLPPSPLFVSELLILAGRVRRPARRRSPRWRRSRWRSASSACCTRSWRA